MTSDCQRTVQQLVADYVVGMSTDDVPALADRRARSAIADYVGVALIGTTTPAATALRATLGDLGEVDDDRPAVLIGERQRAGRAAAALYNATVGHALDFDDDSHPGNVHLTVCIVSALIAACPDSELFGPRFRLAYNVGYEVAGKVGRVLIRARRGAAWHPTGVLGPIGAAAAVANLRELTEQEVGHALGMAASMASGLRANFGSMTKPLHAGRSAQAGLTAALAAARGFEASREVLTGRVGFFQAFTSPESVPMIDDVAADELGRIGRDYEITSDIGLQIKPYPSCAASHPGIEAALKIAAQTDPDKIKSITVGTSHAAPVALIYPRPEVGLQGKFSMQYCVAAALRFGQITLDTFTDERVRDGEVRALMDRMSVDIDERVRESTEHATVVRVDLDNGETVEELVEISKGKGDRWMSDDEMGAKFVDTAGRVLGASCAAQLYSMFLDDAAREQDRLVAGLRGIAT